MTFIQRLKACLGSSSTERELRDILECSPNAVALIDRALNFVRVTGAGIPFLGLSAEELVGKPFLSLWKNPDAVHITQQIERVFSGDRTSFECDYQHPDGHIQRFCIFVGPLFGDDRKIEKVVTVWVDITRQKNFEQELLHRLSLEKARSAITQEFLSGQTAEVVLQNSLGHLLSFSNAGRVCWFETFKFNYPGALSTRSAVAPALPAEPLNTFIEQFGFDGDKARWMTDMEAGLPVLQDDASAAPSVQEFLRSQFIQSFLAVPIFIEKQWVAFVRFDFCAGSAAPTRAHIEFLITLCGALQENLQRLRTQQDLLLLNAAVQNTADGIVITKMNRGDGVPEIVFVNTAACRLNGYMREDLVGSNPFEIFVGPKTEKDLEQKIRSTLEKKENYHAEVFQKRKDGSEYLIELNVSAICDPGGTLIYSISTQRDITEKKALEARASLSGKLESIGQLAAGIAHEINTPAQFISDNLYFVRENWNHLAGLITPLIDIANETGKKRIAFIIKEMPAALSDAIEGVQRISTIVQAMREFSHSSAEKSRANINNAIETTTVVARNEWKYCAELKLELAGNLPQVPCYIGDINQVILNLIVNSAYAIKEKFKDGDQKGLITIRTRHTPTHAVIEVEDNGTGIPEEIRHKVLDPFFTTKAQGQGTGQGLYIAHRVITEKHRGTIDFTSTVGQGTRFVVTLPLEG